MPTIVLIAVLGVFILAWYVGLMIVVARRRLGVSGPLKPFPDKEALVDAGASEHMASLLADGRKIDAIQAYRQEMNRPGLKEAKLAVDAILARAWTRIYVAAGASEDVARFLAEDNRIGAIKAYREETGTTLYEAKEAVDALRIP